MTAYRLARFTAEDAGALAGHYADITERYGDDGSDETTTYFGVLVTGHGSQWLTTVLADGGPWNIFFTAITEVTRHSPRQPVLSDDDERLYRREQET